MEKYLLLVVEMELNVTQRWKCWTLTLGGGSPLGQCYRRYYEVMICTTAETSRFLTSYYYCLWNLNAFEKLYIYI